MAFLRVHLAYKNIQRLRQIVTILIRHGFYPIIERLHLTRLISIPQRIMGKKASAEGEGVYSLATRTRLAFEELGPTFIKFGQILSTRPDLIPEEFVKGFLKLQDEVPPFAFEDVIKVIEQEFRRPLNDLFKEVEEKPIAAASIAQVHRAVTKANEKVVIKVQRPQIETVIENDISILKYLAKLFVKYMPESKLYDPIGMVEEFALTIKREMDFTLEASYTERFKKSLSDDPRVVVEYDKIAFVDFGIVGMVDREMQENLAEIFVGLVSEDYELLTKIYLRMGILPEDINEAAFKREYQDMLLAYFGKPFKMTSVGEILMSYIKLAARYNIRMPRELLLLDKCILELEGLGRLLHPEANVLVESQRFAKKLLAQRFGPAQAAKEAVATVKEYQSFFSSFPSQMSQILKKMVSDKFTIDFVHKGLEDLMGEMDRSSNRLTFGIIVAALIIGSALIMAFGGGPMIFGYPIFGILGFIVAGFLGLWLAFLILR